MKNILLKFFLIVCLCAVALKYSKNEKYYHPLYKSLSNENFGPTDSEKILYINAGIDYIPYDVLELFKKLTRVTVVLDVFDSNEILEAKLLAGNVKYDLVFPSAWPYFSRQLSAEIYQKIDKSKINFDRFDKSIMQKLSAYDKENNFALPYIFGISGIGINENIIDKIEGISKDSLAIIFDPAQAEKISKYRISISESAGELFPLLLSYLGLDPLSENEEDYLKAAEHLKKVRKYISKFTSYGFEDLASENACVAVAASSDVNRINLNNKKSYVKFIFPKEGGAIWVEVVAIPKGATHLNNAYAFLNFLFHPEVIAYITNKTSFANAVPESNKFIDKNILDNNNIYPNEEIRKKCFIEKPMPSNIEILRTRLLTKIKSMDGD